MSDPFEGLLTPTQDWARMFQSLGYTAQGVRDDELVQNAIRLSNRAKRREERMKDTGIL